MWCSLHKSVTHSDKPCRTQHQTMGDNESVIAPARRRTTTLSSLQTTLLPGVILRGKVYRISFAAVDVPTRDEPTKVQGFWPFSPTNDPVASFDTSEWFSVSGGANSEEIEG